MKVLKYQTIGYVWEYNPETEQSEKKQVLFDTERPYSEANEEIAKTEAYNGEYTIEDDGIISYPVAPRNIVSGEYITIDNVLYLATENIPNGEPIIVGQNAIETTVEEQLAELAKGE